MTDTDVRIQTGQALAMAEQLAKVMAQLKSDIHADRMAVRGLEKKVEYMQKVVDEINARHPLKRRKP